MHRRLAAFWMILLAGWMLDGSSAAHAFSPGFIENRGQVDERVLYYATGPGATIYFTLDALVFDLRECPMEGEEASPHRGCAVWVRFDGAQASPVVEARGELPGRYNFFLGSDPARWRTDVPSYKEVVYHDVWRGVDLVFRSRDGELIYDAVGGDEGTLPAPVFQYEGAAEVVVQGDGEVWVETPAGRLLEVRASNEGRFLSAGMAMSGGAMPADRDDPSALLWSTFLGGSSGDGSMALARDLSGDLVLGGITGSPDFPTAPGSYDTSFNGGEWDVFVAMLSSVGSELLWGTFLGGSGTEDLDGGALALDPSGNPVLTGTTSSADFPTTPGAYAPMFNGGERDVFVAMLSSTGNALLWSTFLGGSDGERGTGLDLDPWGDPVLTGTTESSDFPTTPGAYDTSHNGEDADVYVTKLSSTGSAVLWSTFLGGSSVDGGFRVLLALDPSGHPVLTGATESSDFPTTPGAYDTSWNGYHDVFVAKLSSTGSALLWSTFLGGSTTESAEAIVLDLSSNPVLSGWTGSSDFPTTPGAYDTSFNGGEQDGFVAKLSSTGETLLWSTFLGGDGWDEDRTLALDPSQNPILAGGTGSSDFPTTPGAYDTSFNGGALDAFVAQLSSTGEALLWSTFLGGSLDDRALGLTLDPSGNPALAGYTRSADFPTTLGAHDTTFNGGFDAFAAMLLAGGTTGVPESSAPRIVGLSPGLPCPQDGSVNIRYELAQETDVDLRICDATGRLVSALIAGTHPAGMHEVIWDGRNRHGQRMGTGIYFVQLEGAGQELHRKMMLVRE